MRAFIVLCLVAVVCADKLGYNYKPVGHSDLGLSFIPGGPTGHVSGGLNGVVGNGISVGGGSGLLGLVGGINSGSLSIGGADSGSGNFNGGNSYAPQAVLEKEFYTFTANDADFSVPHVDSQIANSGKKGLRVIFIKGPESNGLENAALALSKHIAEQKTDIYVLQKQTDLSSLSNKLHTINSNVNHKPEVHFVKYRTHEDAINAQKAIQNQYESLGGVSNSYNGGEAPVLNFASKGPVATHGSQGTFGTSDSVGSIGSSGINISSGSVGLSGVSAPSNSYIPPSAPSSTYLPA